MDDCFYARVRRQGILTFGDSYMDGWWQCARVNEPVLREKDLRFRAMR